MIWYYDGGQMASVSLGQLCVWVSCGIGLGLLAGIMIRAMSSLPRVFESTLEEL